jgi:hypothetical protein
LLFAADFSACFVFLVTFFGFNRRIACNTFSYLKAKLDTVTKRIQRENEIN